MKRTHLMIYATILVLVAGVAFLLNPPSEKTSSALITLTQSRRGVGNQTSPTEGDSQASSTTQAQSKSGGIWHSLFGGGNGTPAKSGAGASAGTASRISPSSLKDFATVSFPDGKPAYEGETVTAYVQVPSTGQKIGVGVSQAGEYPRIYTAPKESVEVRLLFQDSKPGSKVAVSVQDGGALHTGTSSALMSLDELGQLAFGFNVSRNEGIHRVSFTTTGGEVKTLNFWAGEPNPVQKVVARK